MNAKTTLRILTLVSLLAGVFSTLPVSAQGANVYTSVVVTDITSGAPVVGGMFTTDVQLSITNSGPGPQLGVLGAEIYVGFNPAIVNVVDFDNNPANGTQVEIKRGFFDGTLAIGINTVHIPCPTGVAACVHFAVTQTGTGPVYNRTGAVATIRWVGVAAGSANLGVLVPPSVLSDPNGVSVPINNASAANLTVLAAGILSGHVYRQGVAGGALAGATVTALSVGGPVITTTVTLADGSFAMNVPIGGTYVVQARYPGYLPAQKDNVYVVGASVYIGATTLRGGDVNVDNCVNIFDLVTVASRFSQSGLPATDPADINDDGAINIFDLTIAASNFSRCGVTTW